ncbi:MAG: leucyl aminopeptidase [Prolixibacteraceae bacterium]|nr:leucyl aminopeptidase [Prolixibacteraceae bacterium]
MILKRSNPDEIHQNRCFLIKDDVADSRIPLNEEEHSYLIDKLEKEQRLVEINRYSSKLLIVGIPATVDENARLEAWRRHGNEVAQWAKKEKLQSIEVTSMLESTEQLIAFAEGVILGSYQFLKYQSKAEKLRSTLQEICFNDDQLSEKQMEYLTVLSEAVYAARDMVNEPVISLNAEKFGALLHQMSAEVGIKAEVLGKEQIEALGMGGLLAVNKGSIDPPAFVILEWKPENAVNHQPIVLVGKGVVFDTGGLSLKPTAKSMDYMKSDMAGAAAVAAAIQIAAKNRLPLHIVALIPATDNRPGGNAITPGDVITISNGATVEVLNTDAEGRLILADALCYAKKYDPMLVIDLATLTGSAAMTLGIHGIAAMHNECGNLYELLKSAGERVNERLVELPLWEEYDEMIKSNIADMKNIGGGEAGAITAGKFLQRFVDYPWIHLDIAGPSFLHAADHYRTIGGTATGVRLLSDFFNSLVLQTNSETL